MGVCFSRSSGSSERRRTALDLATDSASLRHSDARATESGRDSGHLGALGGLSRSSSTRSEAGGSSLAPRRALARDLRNIGLILGDFRAMGALPDTHSILELDETVLPIAVKAENLRSLEKASQVGIPHTPLHHFSDLHAFCDAVRNGDLQEGRAVFKLRPNRDHVVSADIKSIDHAISILILEPVDHESTRTLLGSSVTEMAGLLPPNASITALVHDSQKNAVDCPIFALHAASKMLDERAFLDAHHLENAATPGSHRVVNAHAIMPPAFYKHAQSSTAVKNAFKHRPEALQQPIGKQGDETLLQRLEKNRAYRLDIKREINTSTEEKRITYLKRARDYVRTAPEDEVRALTAACAVGAPDWFQESRTAVDACGGE